MIATLAFLCVLSGATDERATVMVMAPTADDVDAALADEVTAAVARVASAEPRARVFSAGDVSQMAELAAEQQLASCASDECLAEIGDALGARYVIFSALRRVAGERRCELRVLDSSSGEIIARADVSARDKAALLARVDDAAREVLRVPFPPAPLLTRPLVIGGGVGAAVGVVVGVVGVAGAVAFDAIARDAASSGDEKAQALALGPASLVVGAVGAAVAVGGVVAVVVGASD